MWKDLKYLAAWTVPISAAIALYFRDEWAWTTVVLVFIVLPVLDQIAPQHPDNYPAESEPLLLKRRFFDWMLYLNLPFVYGAAIAYGYALANYDLTWPELIGLTLSTGIVLGANGINVGHELGHRTNTTEQRLARLLYLPSLYIHFYYEHNWGHHKHVATPLDPATARRNQTVFDFWIQSIAGCWKNAWKIERELRKKDGRSIQFYRMNMFGFQVAQAAWLALWIIFLGPKAFVGAICIALVAVLLLETINYVEHYGLQRRLRPNGRYEQPLPIHSWNSEHEMGRIFLYELTRHSDHHYQAHRKYQILRYFDQSPQMPYGYPAAVLMALVPPVWFRIMNPLIPDRNS